MNLKGWEMFGLDAMQQAALQAIINYIEAELVRGSPNFPHVPQWMFKPFSKYEAEDILASLRHAYTFGTIPTGDLLVRGWQDGAAAALSGASLTAITGVISELRFNRARFSEQLDNSAWVKTGATVTANAAVDPSGASTMDKLVEAAAAGEHSAYQDLAAGNGRLTFSRYVQSAGRSRVIMDISDLSTGSVGAAFDLASSGDVSGPYTTGSWSNISAGSSYVAPGIWRIWVTATKGAGTTARHKLMLNNGSTTSYTGDGTSGVHVWGAQVNGGELAPYQMVTTADPAAAATVWNAVPTINNLAAWGDSLTAGAGGTTAYPQRLATALFRGVHNGGVGGETSTQIKTRMLADTAQHNRWVNLLWLGRNNFTDPTTVKADIAACVSNLHTGNTRFLVMSILNSSAEGIGSGNLATILALNADLAASYASRYVDVRAYLLTKGDGSPTDNADIANGVIPTSLRSDTIHLNDAGYQHVADCIGARLVTLGW